MKKKTIQKVISKKFHEYIKSIKDQDVRKLVSQNSIVSGGCITSMLLNEKVNDYDVYFTNQETVTAVAKYYLRENESLTREIGASVEIQDGRVSIRTEKFGSKVISRIQSTEPDEENIEGGETCPEKEEKKEYRLTFITSNAITLSDKIQLILRFQGTPEEIHKNFDFVHCTNHWVSATKKLTLNQAALECILAKELVYSGSLYPLCSVIRTRKFIKRGWQINAGQYLKMCFQISALDLTDIKVLDDQLIGVDSTYFRQLIVWCTSAQEKDSEFKITAEYLTEIIDRIF